jgi:hypothetical protein
VFSLIGSFEVRFLHPPYGEFSGKGFRNTGGWSWNRGFWLQFSTCLTVDRRGIRRFRLKREPCPTTWAFFGTYSFEAAYARSCNRVILRYRMAPDCWYAPSVRVAGLQFLYGQEKS